MVVELIYRSDRASVSGTEGCRFDSCAGYHERYLHLCIYRLQRFFDISHANQFDGRSGLHLLPHEFAQQ